MTCTAMPVLHSPYRLTEFMPMVWRRFTPRPQPPERLDQDLQLLDEAPQEWIGFVGDICPLFGRTVTWGKHLRRFFADCAVVVGNFEGVLDDQPWLPFRMPHALSVLDALARLQPPERWVLSVANNHAADYGSAALSRSIRTLVARGFRWVGTRERPRHTLLPGVTLTAWSWWSNRRTGDIPRSDPGAPLTEGLHIAFPHWGYEHERKPRPDQYPPARYALTAGHHTHLPQPIEQLPDGRLIAWSLGNFVTGKRLAVLGEGAVLKIGLTRRHNSPAISRVHLRQITLDRSRPCCCRVALDFPPAGDAARITQPYDSASVPAR